MSERVIITEEGRSGSVSYQEGDHRITGWWEFAGGDAVANQRRHPGRMQAHAGS